MLLSSCTGSLRRLEMGRWGKDWVGTNTRIVIVGHVCRGLVETMGEGLWVGGWGGEGGLSGWVLKVSWVIWCLSSWPATSSPDFSLIMQDAGETDLPPSNGCQHPRSSSFKMTWATTENKLVVRAVTVCTYSQTYSNRVLLRLIIIHD